MKRKQYETLYIQLEIFSSDVLTFSTEPEDEKTSGDIFDD